MPSILSVEKNQTYQDILRDSLSPCYDVNICRHVQEVGKTYARKYFDIGIFDLEGGSPDNLETLKTLVTSLPATPIIVTSERDDSDWIVNAVKAGAFDFIAKPYSGERIKLAVNRALEKSSLKNEIDYLRRQQDVVYDLGKIVAESQAMKSVMNLVRKYCETDSNMLVTGETGTGKSFLAGAIHFNSLRKKKPFVKINCANIPETLLESELFGHEKGAFTDAVKTRKGRIEQARGGTVFLDEIGEMSPSLQSKFLQVVEEKTFERLGGNKTIHSDVRIIVATNQDLASMVRKGQFRQDLYFRLNVLVIHLPGLRDRRECIEPLAMYLLGKICRETKRRVKGFSDQALEMMQKYSWPGNIRELANVIERAVLLETGPVIGGKNIHLDSGNVFKMNNDSPPASQKLDESEYKIILDALETNLWIQKKAADQLGISPRALNYKIKKLGITHWSWRKNKG
ncbi:sigma-54-dependent transcriptional regulator [Desulfonatronovibrio hydrogenovorans]|uniref:sigma-54-dependent transcriptional regulator n=1 Tax=Desulfonatronovibrio hydrogenovorans TaxID=53245 RepID=UPI00048A50EB|nr:sigma-54 dependent transcriptional regulator [Desulfonatronovibrio hydrogenovorans]